MCHVPFFVGGTILMHLEELGLGWVGSAGQTWPCVAEQEKVQAVVPRPEIKYV